MVLKLDVVSICGSDVSIVSVVSKHPVTMPGTFLKCPDCKGGYKEFSDGGMDWQIWIKNEAEEIVGGESFIRHRPSQLNSIISLSQN